jgi:hypothetical protein
MEALTIDELNSSAEDFRTKKTEDQVNELLNDVSKLLKMNWHKIKPNGFTCDMPNRPDRKIFEIVAEMYKKNGIEIQYNYPHGFFYAGLIDKP